jgi:hypothetical protein
VHGSVGPALNEALAEWTGKRSQQGDPTGRQRGATESE